MDAWSDFRLPFEPREAKRAFRDELREAVGSLRVGPGMLLAAVYASADASMCDVENILFYNVGMSAFREHMRTGVQFERAMRSPVAGPGGHCRDHHHAYTGAGVQAGFQEWVVNGVVVEATAVEVPSRVERPATWWAAVKQADKAVTATAAGLFGLDIVWHSSPARAPTLHTALKPMLDGVIAGFHSHDGSSAGDMPQRLAAATGLSGSEVDHLLNDEEGAVLGRRRLVWPFRDGVQWNPADDRCVAARVAVGSASHLPSLDIRVLEVSPASSEAASSQTTA